VTVFILKSNQGRPGLKGQRSGQRPQLDARGIGFHMTCRPMINTFHIVKYAALQGMQLMMLREFVFILRSMQGLQVDAMGVCFHTAEYAGAAGWC
jgi:hypothetical protein